ncbi:MAG: hypothetical protein JXB26_09990 [Candidatus Aminicenantes bacterium]|nr:hypothetical protein [Candidatus Aminicenantes bacterium]
MLDFTLKKYRELIQILLSKRYEFQTLQDFIYNPKVKTVVLRHDIDSRPKNALETSKIEKQAGIKTSYYFRAVEKLFNPRTIKYIYHSGHEIGYHYENLSYISRKYMVKEEKKLYELAIQDFKKNLDKFRRLATIKTISMHGSPLSKYDNRDLWNKYNYRDYGIIGEPYFDINFDEVLYLSDTGRTWTTYGGNIRDRVQSKYNYRFKSTFDIIHALEKNDLPDQIMINVHPQRWNDKTMPWAKELVWQKMKNIVKNVISK